MIDARNKRWFNWFVALVLAFPVAGTACAQEIETETGDEGGGGETEGGETEGGETEGGETEGGETEGGIEDEGGGEGGEDDGDGGAEVDVETD
jgi:hypothetical protein